MIKVHGKIHIDYFGFGYKAYAFSYDNATQIRIPRSINSSLYQSNTQNIIKLMSWLKEEYPSHLFPIEKAT